MAFVLDGVLFLSLLVEGGLWVVSSQLDLVVGDAVRILVDLDLVWWYFEVFVLLVGLVRLVRAFGLLLDIDFFVFLLFGWV